MDTVLALVLFPSLSAIAWTLINPNLGAVRPVFREQCQAPLAGPNLLPITGNPGFDRFVCVLVSLFEVGLEPDHAPFMRYFLATCVPAAAMFASVESSRKGRRFIVSYAALISGALGQVLTFAVVLPIYFLYFVLVGRYNTGMITQAHAEATLFGVFIGWVTPSVALFTMPDPSIKAFFQIAPVLAFVCQIAHITIRSPSSAPASGFTVIQGGYIASFVVASSMHLTTVAKFTSFEDFRAMFIPTLLAADIPSAVMNIFQVDLLTVAATWAFGSLWFARTKLEVLQLALWFIVGSVIVGPGAAFIAAALWRESYLEAACLRQKH